MVSVAVAAKTSVCTSIGVTFPLIAPVNASTVALITGFKLIFSELPAITTDLCTLKSNKNV